MEVLTAIRNWSEVWSLLIPLTVIAFLRFKNPKVYPIIYYIFLALVINLMATIMFVYFKKMPPFLKNNNILYNLHSIIRVCFFGWYILSIHNKTHSIFLKITLTAYIAFILFNFILIESPWYFSSKLFSAESVVLLSLCIFSFVLSIRDESNTNWIKDPSFIICVGLGLYETINFFIFLFFYPLHQRDPVFGKLTWTIHNITFVIFCIMIAVALIRSYDKNNLAKNELVKQ
jgi:hypothetical protein